MRTQVAVQRAARSTIDFRLRVQHIHTYSWSVQQQATKRTSECHSKRIDKNLYYVCISFVFARGARRGSLLAIHRVAKPENIYSTRENCLCATACYLCESVESSSRRSDWDIFGGSRRRTLNGSQSRIKYSGVHVCQLLHYLTHV